MRAAFILASSSFQDPQLQSLGSPTADAASLAAVLEDRAIGSFDDVVEHIDKPTYVLLEEINNFFADRSQNDFLFFYISGHGVKDDRGKLYFATTNTRLNRLPGTAIAASYITDCAQSSKARKQLLVIDTCFSGAFSRGMLLKSASNISPDDICDAGAGLAVLTASTSIQFALESRATDGRFEPSVFTKVLVDGLRTGEADSDASGHITLSDLYRYISERIRQTGATQTPQLWTIGTEGELIVARNPNPRASALPDELISDLLDPRPAVLLPAIARLEAIALGSHRGKAASAIARMRELLEHDSRSVAVAANHSLGKVANRELDARSEHDNAPPHVLAPRTKPATIRKPGPHGEAPSKIDPKWIFPPAPKTNAQYAPPHHADVPPPISWAVRICTIALALLLTAVFFYAGQPKSEKPIPAASSPSSIASSQPNLPDSRAAQAPRTPPSATTPARKNSASEAATATSSQSRVDEQRSQTPSPTGLSVPNTPAQSAEVPRQKSISVWDTKLGTAIGADKKVTSPSTVFKPSDTMYLEIRTEGEADHAILRVIWKYQDGQTINDSSQALAPTGPAVTTFHINKPDGWPIGNYDAIVELDGKWVTTREFVVSR